MRGCRLYERWRGGCKSVCPLTILYVLTGSGLSESLPSEGDIELIPVEENEKRPSVPGDPVLEDYDDIEEPQESHGEEAEVSRVLLGPMGVHLCAFGFIVIFLLYCFYSETSALVDAYI